ncbi:MAG TPA: alpha/beta fold hydrolase [Bacteroidota bacterium]|nr:alpha/beta fold hydrolase [Bacteroidota bacterium]
MSLFYKAAPKPSTQTELHPALILLHGRGTDENDLLGLASYFDPRFQIISVRAPMQFPYGGYTWFDLNDLGNIDAGQLQQSYRQVLEVIDELPKKYSIDPSNIFLYGFSMGAMMSLVLALAHPEKIRGAVVHSGLLPENAGIDYRWQELQKTSFFIAHGTYDPVVPVELGSRANELLAKTQARLHYKEYPIGHTISEESLNDTAEWLRAQLENQSH